MRPIFRWSITPRLEEVANNNQTLFDRRGVGAKEHSVDHSGAVPVLRFEDFDIAGMSSAGGCEVVRVERFVHDREIGRGFERERRSRTISHVATTLSHHSGERGWGEESALRLG